MTHKNLPKIVYVRIHFKIWICQFCKKKYAKNQKEYVKFSNIYIILKFLEFDHSKRHTKMEFFS